MIGSKTGPDGSGTSDERFVSDSGRVIIDPSDFIFENARGWPHTWPTKGFEIKWKAESHYVDEYDASKGGSATVAQGLTNREHTIEVIPNGDGAIPIKTIRVFSPPLR